MFENFVRKKPLFRTQIWPSKKTYRKIDSNCYCFQKINTRNEILGPKQPPIFCLGWEGEKLWWALDLFATDNLIQPTLFR